VVVVAVSISDWFVIAPWLAFAAGVIIFYLWPRRPPRPPVRRTRLPASTASCSWPRPRPPADAHASEQAAESEHRETTTS
jgi:hypothetical protein